MTDIGKLILRVAIGGMMLTHGYPKLVKLLSGAEITFGDPIGIGPEISFIMVIFAEFVCSILVIIGYKTRLAAFPLVIAMLVAGLIAHAEDPFARQEKALMFAAVYFSIMFMGPGAYSIDEQRNAL
jgi:putative oxidoreductase